ncbi:hypothetical protein [Micromonospora sp. MW-13]|uniref:hypothetical protein n=1 Tax=Micromonospora sp. MW-13 TaxID=2094022 RepID=UPI000FFE8E11|nr:hypothetical protein [Micromonospora sp. MW-13]
MQEQIGLRPVSVPGEAGIAQTTSRVAVTGDDPIAWYSLSNPLVWVGGVLAVTFGLASVAGSVRLGRAKISASAGKG